MRLLNFWAIQQILRAEDDVETPVVSDPTEKVVEEKPVEEEEKEVEDEEKPAEKKKTDKELVEGDEEEAEDEDKEDKPKEEKEEELEEDLVKFSYQDLKAAFKDKPEQFKAAKAVFFREQEFTKRFPTVEDADEALAEQQSYQEVRSLVMSGNSEDFLNQVSEASPKAVAKFAEGFLPALYKVDKQAYIDITSPVIKNLLRNAAQSNDKNVIAAAKVIHKEIFDTYELGKPEPPKAKEEDEEFNEDKKNFYGERKQKLEGEVYVAIATEFDKAISAGLDPTNSIQPGLKKVMLREIKSRVDELIAKDPDHMSRMKALWRREQTSKYSGALKDSIKTAYLSRAKALIPKVRKEVRAEFLETQVNEDKEKSSKINRDKHVPAGDTSRPPSRQITVTEARSKKLTDKQIMGMS